MRDHTTDFYSRPAALAEYESPSCKCGECQHHRQAIADSQGCASPKQAREGWGLVYLFLTALAALLVWRVLS